MKKTITAIVVMVILTASATFANETNKNNNVDERVERSFKKEFSTAQETSWTKINDNYKVQFVLNGQVMFAFLNEEGVILGACRNILSNQLTMPLLIELKEDYSGYWITELFELTKDNQTNYYVTLENGDQKITLKSENANSWNLKTKTRK